MIRSESIKREKDEDIIKLNVGGQVFTTTKYTLTRQIPMSQLSLKRATHSHLLQVTFENTVYDKDNLIFFDRNPKYFSYILDFLRTTELDVDAFLFSVTEDHFLRHLIIKEFEFFKIFEKGY